MRRMSREIRSHDGEEVLGTVEWQTTPKGHTAHSAKIYEEALSLAAIAFDEYLATQEEEE